MGTTPVDIFEKLMALGPPETVTASGALRRIGILVDLAGDLDREDGTARAFEWCDVLAGRKLTKQHAALLEYFRANAWANRQRSKHLDADAVWQWEQPEQQKQIFHLRRAVLSPGFDKLSPLRRCQILTNLANQLNTVGRCVEAIATWARVLSINPAFGMALGNRGYGLTQYARSLYDKGHRGVFLYFAHKDLSDALSSRAKFWGHEKKNAKAFFAAKKAEIEDVIDVKRAERSIRMDEYPIGTSPDERHYRQWVLRQRFFLNPLNDLGSYTIAARDMLSLPSFTAPIGEPPSLISFFDHMKQEFVSGRWLLYEGLNADRVHFSDRRVTLYNTLDYPSYSLAVEKVKAAYRIGYSILDKIAFFLNEYAKLGVGERQVYFRTIWYKNCDFRNDIRPEFLESKNWPLRGLYWLSKDLFDPDLQDVMEPDAQALYTIRNRLEHSYLKIHEILLPHPDRERFADAWTDRLAYSVGRDDFGSKTLHVFRLARAGLIYLALGMHREEKKRAKTETKGFKVPMTLGLWPDARKR
jgi:hypothetical protein